MCRHDFRRQCQKVVCLPGAVHIGYPSACWSTKHRDLLTATQSGLEAVLRNLIEAKSFAVVDLATCSGICQRPSHDQRIGEAVAAPVIARPVPDLDKTEPGIEPARGLVVGRHLE